jgi:flagellar hook-associated protein 3 FlgL
MRIATSTIYEQQTLAIDNQAYQYSQIGQELSSGKQLNAPSDDPEQIAQDLSLRTAISAGKQQGTNVTNAIAELTSTDSALSSLTSVIQSARQLAIEGASQSLSASQRSDIAKQADQLLQQAIAIGNTQYGGTYIFGGSANPAMAPVQSQGSPISQVTFAGNEQVQGQLVYNGQSFALSTTFQAAFNYNASDGSPSVFGMLINLRNTLQNSTAVDQSAGAINQAGSVIYGPQTAGVGPAPTTLAAATFATTPSADNATPPSYSLQISSDINGQQVTKTLTFDGTAPIDDGTPSSVVGAINALTAQTGITAAFDAATQRFSLTGLGSFSVTDVPTPAGATTIPAGTAVTTAATTSANLTKVLGLTSQADFVQNLSTQLGDIDHVLNTTLDARAVVGARMQTLTSISHQLQSEVTDNTNSESSIEDVDVAAATTKFSQTQTALQAAYSTTTRLESMTLMNYLSSATGA